MCNIELAEFEDNRRHEPGPSLPTTSTTTRSAAALLGLALLVVVGKTLAVNEHPGDKVAEIQYLTIRLRATDFNCAQII